VINRALIGLIIWIALVDAQPACAAEPAEGVMQSLTLAPGPGNPRNSEGDFINIDDHRILFVYTHFTVGTGDAASAYLAGRWSSDGGKTWDAHDQTIVPKPPIVQNIMSVSFLRLRDGRIALFYLIKKSGADCRLVMRTSIDQAQTWSEPRLCMPDEGYFVVNNGRVIQLHSGRLLIPAARHDHTSRQPGAARGIACCFFSDDAGQTWRRSKSALEAPPESHSGLQEPLAVELKDDRLMMLCRTDRGCQFRSYSADAGDTWSPAEPTDILSPLSPASIKRIPSTGDLLMVWNDHSHIAPNLRGRRTPLTVAISEDEGKSWKHHKTLYDDPLGWYCYTAIDFAGDRVLLGHCAGQQTKQSSGLATTVVTSFDVHWLYQ
jgi:hypothetical protein